MTCCSPPPSINANSPQAALVFLMGGNVMEAILRTPSNFEQFTFCAILLQHLIPPWVTVPQERTAALCQFKSTTTMVTCTSIR